MQNVNTLLHYLKYLQQARNKFDIHPPFLYKLVTEVFEDTGEYPDYQTIENLKQQLLKNNDVIEIHDLGAGSGASKNTSRSVKSITRHSSKP